MGGNMPPEVPFQRGVVKRTKSTGLRCAPRIPLPHKKFCIPSYVAHAKAPAGNGRRLVLYLKSYVRRVWNAEYKNPGVLETGRRGI